MERSLWAVLAGTFTLRFSTGLTGAMLAFYLADLPAHGGPTVSSTTIGLFTATFFAAELVMSPVFGLLSDRFGHHRVMVFGPIFGGIAVILTGLTTNLVLLGGTRFLEGLSTAASVPSILGYIALATAGNEVLRGKAAARFEGATLAGLGVGIIVAPKLFEALGPTAFFLNAIVYAVSFAIYWLGVKDPAGERESVEGEHVGFRRYATLIRSSHVLLLAPTWIAINASIGLWMSQSLFQFAKSNPKFPDQVLMRGFSPNEITVAAIAIALLFGGGLLYWGNRFKSLRRTTIIGYGIAGGGLLVVAGLLVEPLGRSADRDRARRRRAGRPRPVRAGGGHACRPGAARRYLGALPARPRRDHGPVLGVPRDRADRGCPDRRRGRGPAWHRRDAVRDRRPAGRGPHPAVAAPGAGAPAG